RKAPYLRLAISRLRRRRRPPPSRGRRKKGNPFTTKITKTTKTPVLIDKHRHGRLLRCLCVLRVEISGMPRLARLVAYAHAILPYAAWLAPNPPQKPVGALFACDIISQHKKAFAQDLDAALSPDSRSADIFHHPCGAHRAPLLLDDDHIVHPDARHPRLHRLRTAARRI